MCCNRIDTDVLLANLFASASKEIVHCQKIIYSINQIREYLFFLQNSFPVYVVSNFSEESVEICAIKYPLYYQLSGCKGKDLVVCSGGKVPNIDFFNSVFSPSISNYIKRITKIFLNSKTLYVNI